MGNFTPDQVIDYFNRTFSAQDWILLLKKLGWTENNLESQFPTFTRQGKDSGVSGELLTSNQVILFHNFSDNSNFPKKKNGKQTYSPAEAITHFFFKNDWKSSFKYFQDYTNRISNNKTIINGRSKTFKGSSEINFKEKIDLSCVNKELYYNDKQVRVYKLSVNTSILNKNLNPVTQEPYRYYNVRNNKFEDDYNSLKLNFKNVSLTAYEIADIIGKGHSICSSVLKEDVCGKTIRNKENWNCSELVTIDIDKGLTIRECFKKIISKYTLILYTTPNHTKNHQRYRLIFPLPYIEDVKERFKKTIDGFIAEYGADHQASSIVNAFYGNSNAFIILVQSKEYLRYKNGCIVEKGSIDNILSEISQKNIQNVQKSQKIEEALINEEIKWFEIIFQNSNRIYVQDYNIDNIELIYRNNGIVLKDIKPVHYDEQTKKISYLELDINEAVQ